MSDPDPRERFRSIEVLFREVRLVPPGERRDWLAGRTDDPGLVAEVLALVAEDERTTDGPDPLLAAVDEAVGSAAVAMLQDEPADAPAATDPAAMPERIGDYRIRREIGRGGMGVVYEAEQADPRRRVALKVVATGLASPSLVDRFRRETQVLGRLEHPGIARILEAGTWDAGAGAVPFFAMDFVDGVAITAALRGAPVHRVLTVMAKVADAVHHAHQRGVIHRDLKPANVLVGSDDQPRVVDFGVARLLEPADDDLARTVSGHLVGTPGSMSPEQASGDPDAVDARTDIHALGLLTHELLGGSPPMDLEGRSLDEQLRRIRDVAPRRLGPRDGVPRDVALVVARALEKDPDRRHASAAALAEDLRRARDGRPVSARAPSATYQLGRLAARHPVGTGLVALSTALVVGGTILVGVLLARSIRAEARATQEARIARGVTQFLVEDVLQAMRPTERDTETVTVDALVDAAGAAASLRFAADPEVGREVLATLAEIDLTLGRPASAAGHLAAIDALPPSPADRAGAGAGDPLAAARADTIRLVRAGVWSTSGREAEALELYRAVLADRRARLGPDHPDTLVAAYETARVRCFVEDLEDGLADFQAVLAGYERVIGRDERDTLDVVSEIGSVLMGAGRYEEAMPYVERVAAGFAAAAGPDAWPTLMSLNQLGELRRGLGDFDAALAAFEAAVAGLDRRGTPAASELRITLDSNLGLVHMELGDFETAEPYIDRALAGAALSGDDRRPDFQTIRHNAGALKMLLGQLDEADALLSDVLARRTEVLGPDDFETLMTRGLRAEVMRRAGDLTGALPEFAAVWAGQVALVGADHEYARASAQRCLQIVRAEGDEAAAEIWRARGFPAADADEIPAPDPAPDP